MARSVGGETQRMYLVGCEPAVLETEELGLSAAVQAAVPQAVELIESLVRELRDKPAGEAGGSRLS